MEIMSIITLESKEIQEIFTQGDTKIDFSSEKYAKTLLWRANEVLLRSLEKEQDVDKIEAMFSEIRTELIQFGSFFHVTQDNNNNLDAILKKYKIKKKVVSGLDLAKWDTISHSYKEAIRNFYLRLYRNHNEFWEIMKIVDTIIEEDVKSSDVKYIIFYLWGGKSQEFPLLTLKLRTIDKKHVHFGWFNADPMILKSWLWMNILNCYLEKYNNNTFTATILEGSEGLFKEYKKLWFVIDTDLQKHEGTTLRFYNIRREATS